MSLRLRRLLAASTVLVALTACGGSPISGGEELENPDAGGDEETLPNEGREDVEEPDVEDARGDDVNEQDDPGTLED